MFWDDPPEPPEVIWTKDSIVVYDIKEDIKEDSLYMKNYGDADKCWKNRYQ